MKITYGERHENLNGWCRRVTLDNGHIVDVSVVRGKRVRMAYARRGQFGFQWYAYCRESVHEEGNTLPKTVRQYETIQCNKSTGVRGILKFHGIIE